MATVAASVKEAKVKSTAKRRAAASVPHGLIVVLPDREPCEPCAIESIGEDESRIVLLRPSVRHPRERREATDKRCCAFDATEDDCRSSAVAKATESRQAQAVARRAKEEAPRLCIAFADPDPRDPVAELTLEFRREEARLSCGTWR